MGHFIFCLAMGLLNRWRGHASPWKKYLPRPFSQMLLALPFGIAAYMFGFIPEFILDAGQAMYWQIGMGVVTWAITTGLLLTGWGNVYDLAHAPRGKELEKVEYLIYGWLYGKIPEYWYDVVGMALRGMLITLPTAIATLNPLMLLAGLGLVLGYIYGWFANDYHSKVQKTGIDKDGNPMTYEGLKYYPPYLDEATAIGEFLGMYLIAAFSLAALFGV